MKRDQEVPSLPELQRLARALGAAPVEPLPVLRAQAERLFAALLEMGDPETFVRLNPFLALLVGVAGKRRGAAPPRDGARGQLPEPGAPDSCRYNAHAGVGQPSWLGSPTRLRSLSR
jgi:hypothetical protein